LASSVCYCESCEGVIESDHPQAKYCNRCRAEIHMSVWTSVKEKREKTQAEKREKEKLEKDKRTYKGPSIADINRRAEELGMSYGQYVSKYGSVII